MIITGSERARRHRDPVWGRQHGAREEQPGAGADDVHWAPQEVWRSPRPSIPGNGKTGRQCRHAVNDNDNVFRITTRSRWTSGSASGWGSATVWSREEWGSLWLRQMRIMTRWTRVKYILYHSFNIKIESKKELWFPLHNRIFSSFIICVNYQIIRIFIRKVTQLLIIMMINFCFEFIRNNLIISIILSLYIVLISVQLDNVFISWRLVPLCCIDLLVGGRGRANKVPLWENI